MVGPLFCPARLTLVTNRRSSGHDSVGSDSLMPGHHAEVLGDETVGAYEFESSTAVNYAQGKAA